MNASKPSEQAYQRYEAANQTLWRAADAILQASRLLNAAMASLQLPQVNRTLERAKWVINAVNYTSYGATSVSKLSEGIDVHGLVAESHSY